MKRSVLFLVATILLVGQNAFSDMQATQSQLDSWSAFNNAHGNLWQITWGSLGMPAEIDGGTI